ncbi:Nicotinate-nucleotide--dimethylbenzimidazole phosphoribosyltransferase [Desulfamplus magnetovallimortis]|uniref:Nicotinate-nucleotide--dimethylbenzimidazole phosphoribosyltransferase n=1 Tax=Desulfamplus magnetovallimortis TaxID=1246637 RepID=A0A1W1HAA6_9BACT|nr:nicotinate-nucleotide--dimethylbenzimidazole phosphoribosyltransferase [Desulfamplus magnetovallimortis]SLM29335.1 Nicotinate-nucleotide--dimethylbenzimidazole phosphoribosyltransferase [Desulfamplus magnetovallimortis]
MEQLEKTIERIEKPDMAMKKKAMQRLADQARPAGSLGILEPISAQLAAIKGTLDVHLTEKIVITCAGDHGVVKEGVSLFPPEVTPQMVENFVNGGASINVLARQSGARVMVADLGVNFDFSPEMPIFHKKVRKGTSNFTKTPAMTRDEAVKSINAGISIVDELVKNGNVDIIGTGDMGIGNTTPSSAIIAAFSGISPSELTGRGTGINDAILANKIRVIEKGLELHRPDPNDAVDVLSKLGGFEIGGLAGLVLGAAAHKIPVVCDGIISTAGALIAFELAPGIRDYLFAGHRSVEKGHRFMHERMDLVPLLDLQFRLGEGTGAAVAFQLLDAATRILAEIKTFEEVAIINAQK